MKSLLILLFLSMSALANIDIGDTTDAITVDEVVARTDYLADYINEFFTCQFNELTDLYEFTNRLNMPQDDVKNIFVQVKLINNNNWAENMETKTALTEDTSYLYLTTSLALADFDTYDCEKNDDNDDYYEYICDITYNYFASEEVTSYRLSTAQISVQINRLTFTTLSVEVVGIKEDLCDCTILHDVPTSAYICTTSACDAFYGATDDIEFILGEDIHILMQMDNESERDQFRLELTSFHWAYKTVEREFLPHATIDCSPFDNCSGALKVTMQLNMVDSDITITLTSLIHEIRRALGEGDGGSRRALADGDEGLQAITPAFSVIDDASDDAATASFNFMALFAFLLFIF
jgi:hypothetical protein